MYAPISAASPVAPKLVYEQTQQTNGAKSVNRAPLHYMRNALIKVALLCRRISDTGDGIYLAFRGSCERMLDVATSGSSTENIMVGLTLGMDTYIGKTNTSSFSSTQQVFDNA